MTASPHLELFANFFHIGGNRLGSSGFHQIRSSLPYSEARLTLPAPIRSFHAPAPEAHEILALQWKHVAEDHVQVVHRLYRGKLDRPKSERSTRKVALSVSTCQLIEQWRRQQGADPEA